MRYRDAIKIHAGDEVFVKKLKSAETVIEVEQVDYWNEHTGSKVRGISFHATDGNWYGYKEVI